MAAVHVDSKNFEEEVLRSNVPVLVDFWAVWCGPCQMMGPVIEQLSEERKDIKFCKVNVDDCQDLADKYEIMSIPAFKFLRNGEVVSEIIGAVGKDGLLKLIEG